MKPRIQYMTVATFMIIFCCTFFAAFVQPNLSSPSMTRAILSTEATSRFVAKRKNDSVSTEGMTQYFNIHKNLDITQAPKTSSEPTTNPNRNVELTPPTGKNGSTTLMFELMHSKHLSPNRLTQVPAYDNRNGKENPSENLKNNISTLSPNDSGVTDSSVFKYEKKSNSNKNRKNFDVIQMLNKQMMQLHKQKKDSLKKAQQGNVRPKRSNKKLVSSEDY